MTPGAQPIQTEEPITELPLHQKKINISNLPTNAIADHPGFEFKPGLKPEEKPELKLGELGKAVYETSAWGLTQRITEDALRPDEPTPNYDVYKDIPTEFLNEQDIWYFLDSPNSIQTASRANKLRREKNHQELISNYPYSYAGAAIAEGLIDPVNWLFPGTRIAAATKEAYTAAMAGKSALTAKFLTRAAYESAALGALSSATQEALIHQTQVSRTEAESVYAVASSALLSGVIGTIVPIGISGYHLHKAESQVSNMLAGNTPPPLKEPTGKLYAMDLAQKAEMKGDDTFATLPGWVKKIASISPAGRLRNSKSVSANMASSDLATSSLLINKNITKNQPSPITIDEMIVTQRGKARKTAIDINAIFMEQQNVSGMFAGLRSRIQEARGKGMSRVDFSHAMNEAMESGAPHSNPAVNSAVARVKFYLDDTKKTLVDLGKMDKKFLEPEFDKYWTRHWQETQIARNHEDAKLLFFKWYEEVNNYYKANQEKLGKLNKKVEFAEKEFSKSNGNIKRVLNSKEYKLFQQEKKQGKHPKSKRFQRITELEARKKDFKKEIELRKEKLYNFIPRKYLTPGGFVPLGNKNPLELHAAAMQTFYRTTGSDITMFMNPMISGGGRGTPDPLQMRVLTIPWDYSATTFDGRTIRASDFFSRDIWKMLDNYSGQLSSTIAFSKLARRRGFKDEAELKRWYLEEIEADFNELMKGKSGKEALDLNREKKAAFNNLNALFNQQYNIGGGSSSQFGPGPAKFVRRIRQYNSQRMLGSATLSNLTDIFILPFRQGIGHYLQEYTIPFFRKFLDPKSPDAIKLNKNDVKDLGYALETEGAQIAKRFYDNDDLLIEQKWWHSITEPLTTTFSSVTLMNQLNDYIGATAGHVSISRTLRALANKFEKNKTTKRADVRLRNLTISPESERHIYEMFKEKGGKSNGAYFSNHTEWNVNTEARAKAYEEFVNSWQKDLMHSTLVSSKSEQPEFYQSLLGRVLFHFKDYLFAANQKLLMSGLQKLGQREYEVLLSMFVMTASGSFTYILNGLAKDPTKELDLSFSKLLREGIDRSALLGIIMEPINMFQKQGLLPGQSVSRYYSRGILGNWVGPEIGTAQELFDALAVPVAKYLKGEGTYTTKDALNILRLIPFQNLFYLRYLNEQITKNVAEELGATPKE